MSKQVILEGNYNWEVLGTAFDFSKGGFPQLALKAKAVQRWIDNPDELASMGIDEAGYVDWTPHEEEFTGYLILFNDANKYVVDGPEKTVNFNYGQVKAALGWEGVSFDDLNSDKFVGQRFGGKLEAEEYNGKTSLKFKWLGKPDLGPAGNMRRASPDAIKSANSRLVVAKTHAPKARAVPQSA